MCEYLLQLQNNTEYLTPFNGDDETDTLEITYTKNGDGEIDSAQFMGDDIYAVWKNDEGANPTGGAMFVKIPLFRFVWDIFGENC